MIVRSAGSGRFLAVALATMVVAYVVWKITQSPEQATQFAFNGLSVGAIYALLAIGFTLVYSTVRFFDLYYGAAAAIGAYGVFYLRSHDTLGGQYEVNEVYVNVLSPRRRPEWRLGPSTSSCHPASGSASSRRCVRPWEHWWWG